MSNTVYVLNGPNLNLLGLREPDTYGAETYDALIARVTAYAATHDIALDAKQSNHEGELITWIQEAHAVYDGIIINPAAYTHTSVGIRDALLAVGLPVVEVHISNIYEREDFRHHSYVKDIASHSIIGKGTDGYVEAVDWFKASANAAH